MRRAKLRVVEAAGMSTAQSTGYDEYAGPGVDGNCFQGVCVALVLSSPAWATLAWWLYG
jgi:hypothetical protein